MATSSEDLLIELQEKQPKKFIAISDLHIGIGSGPDGSRSSDYYLSDQQTYTYLMSLIQQGYTVVLNGDIFECWETDISRWKKEFESLVNSGLKGVSFNDWHEMMGKPRFEAIEKAFPLTVGLIKNHDNIIYVNGNHDACCTTAKSANGNSLIPRARQTFEVRDPSSGCSVYFAHGHQADHYCSGKKQGIGRLITCCVSVAEELIDPDIDIKASKLADTIGLTDDSNGVKYKEYAGKVAGKYHYDCVVYGHTHVQDLAILQNNILYANTGKTCHSKAHDRIDEVEIHITEAGLEVIQQQRYLDAGFLNVERSIIKGKNGVCVAKPIGAKIPLQPMQVEMKEQKEQSLPALELHRKKSFYSLSEPEVELSLVDEQPVEVQLRGSVAKKSNIEYMEMLSTVTSFMRKLQL